MLIKLFQLKLFWRNSCILLSLIWKPLGSAITRMCLKMRKRNTNIHHLQIFYANAFVQQTKFYFRRINSHFNSWFKGSGWGLSMIRVRYKLTSITKTKKVLKKRLKANNIINFKATCYKFAEVSNFICSILS